MSDNSKQELDQYETYLKKLVDTFRPSLKNQSDEELVALFSKVIAWYKQTGSKLHQTSAAAIGWTLILERKLDPDMLEATGALFVEFAKENKKQETAGNKPS